MGVETDKSRAKRHFDDADSEDVMEIDRPMPRKKSCLEDGIQRLILGQRSCIHAVSYSKSHLQQDPMTAQNVSENQEEEHSVENRIYSSNPMVTVVQRRPTSDSSDDREDDSDTARDMSAQTVDGQAKFKVSDVTLLKRLLILGNSCCVRPESARADPLTSNPEWSVVDKMIDEGRGQEVVEVLRDVSVKVQTSRQRNLTFVLAMCTRSKDTRTKATAMDAMLDMCSTPTHLFQLVHYSEAIGKKTFRSTGWGRSLRRAVCKWYNRHAHNPLHLAVHVTKYRTRHGWTHRDLFRLSHIKPANDAIGFIICYLVKGLEKAQKSYPDTRYHGQEHLQEVHEYLKAVDEAKRCVDENRTLELIREHRLLREHLSTVMLNSPGVWRIMLPDMPVMALIRNLGKMTRLKLFETPESVNIVRTKLTSMAAMKKARVHPLTILTALRTYVRGRGEKGRLVWQPNVVVVETLNTAFYQSFATVEPTGKRFLIALDISSSMDSKFPNTSMSCREAATCVAMITAKAERHCDVVGFHTDLTPLPQFQDEGKTLEQLMAETRNLGFGATDCSKPMTYACQRQKDYDIFMILTDNETNSHRTPPWSELQKYREAMSKPTAKLIVVAMTALDFSIARPDDVHMLDVVGFDPELPEVIREFVMGHLE